MKIVNPSTSSELYQEVAKDTETLSDLESANGGLHFGAAKRGEAGTFFSGLIDKIRVYERAVTP